jgi:hypothetical protein
LHRLDHHRRGISVDPLERSVIAERQVRHAGQQRLEWVAEDGVAADRKCAEGVAVEGSFEGDELGASGVLASHLQRSLDRLCAAVREVCHG